MATALGLFGSRANLQVVYILFKLGTRCVYCTYVLHGLESLEAGLLHLLSYVPHGQSHLMCSDN